MTLNERILDFLDGSLPAEDEAELLHTLSVSPEKRSVLREFMEQDSLVARDSKTLSVPYETEQRLWARLGEVMPESKEATPLLVPAESSIAGDASNTGFFAHALRGASVLVSALALFAGIGIGYFAGAHTAAVPTQPATVQLPATHEISTASTLTTFHGNRGIARRTMGNASRLHTMHVPTMAGHPALASMTIPALALVTPNPTYGLDWTHLSEEASPPVAPQEPAISQAQVRSISPIAMNDIGGDGARFSGIKPRFHHIQPLREPSPSFLQRFEFRLDEGVGKEFPNNNETNISQPVITNTSISAFFQVLPHSNVLWAGIGYGSENVTRKNLFVQPGDPIDPSQQVLNADTVHAQTGYFAGMAELHLPAFASTDLIFQAGYGLASIGQIMFGEIGLHYNISNRVGTHVGLRVLRYSYNLNGQEANAIQSGTSGLAISNAVVASTPSFNTELDAGLFFHF